MYCFIAILYHQLHLTWSTADFKVLYNWTGITLLSEKEHRRGRFQSILICGAESSVIREGIFPCSR